MKAVFAGLIVSLGILGVVSAVPAADLKEKVKVEILSAGFHPGMDPGLYVCAGGHLHVKGTVQNLTGVALASIKLEGKAYDAEDKFLGMASPWKKAPLLVSLKPGEKREFDMEFLTITGPRVGLAKKHEIVVVEVQPSN
ncbi:MAG: hypothetical protein HYZ11_10065 [Candidatus Tectomicrobia bacterium]|uniref:Uncharacterized protein n=1 Tax=Tectimicrobiota bacterium TaxID=2528274 RepID=A0A932I0N3_UNCTE|nr:hypothetical protein [Candidatus Tectomicrobia bacterium]